MDVGSTELKILQVTQPYVDQGYSQLHLLKGQKVKGQGDYSAHKSSIISR